MGTFDCKYTREILSLITCHCRIRSKSLKSRLHFFAAHSSLPFALLRIANKKCYEIDRHTRMLKNITFVDCLSNTPCYKWCPNVPDCDQFVCFARAKPWRTQFTIAVYRRRALFCTPTSHPTGCCNFALKLLIRLPQCVDEMRIGKSLLF